MAEPKTRPTTETLEQFLARVPEAQRADCATIAGLMQNASGRPAVIWGTGIVGFGRYLQKYANGKDLEWPVIAFAPRKSDLTLYVASGGNDWPDLLAKLGKYKNSKGCLYVKRLSDVDIPTLTEIISRSVAATKKDRVD